MNKVFSYLAIIVLQANMVTAGQRRETVRWFFQLNNHFGFYPETFFLSTTMLDKVLHSVKVWSVAKLDQFENMKMFVLLLYNMFITGNLRLPYILWYKSHFLYSEIDTKIKCNLYMGETKREDLLA